MLIQGDLAVLRPFSAAPMSAGVFCDFDGTLAPIVADPAEARPLPTTVDALSALSGRLRRVVVVSGRPASFLADHLGGRGFDLWGLYGLEQVGPTGVVVSHPDAEHWREIVAGVAARARGELPATIGVEAKGLSLTLHFRTVPDAGPTVQAWAADAAAATGLELHAARMSFELRLPLRRDKGAVVAELASGLEAVCFLGDDRGDLSAFDALDRLADEGAHAVRVAVVSDEAPSELIERADLLVGGPEGVGQVLGEMWPG